jgi:hypothetical protein
MPGSPLSQDLVVAQTLLEGIWTPSKGLSMLSWGSWAVIGGQVVHTGVQCSLVEVRSN